MKIEHESYFTLESVQSLYPEVKAIHGPYLRKDKRLMVVFVKKETNKVSSISYPKVLYEVYYNKRLGNDDTIDHIDGNPLNNNIDNLRVLDRTFHATMDKQLLIPSLVKCLYCGKEFFASKYANERNTGYFCSRSCSGNYGRKIQMGIIKKEYIKKIDPEYFRFHDLYDYENDFGKEFSLDEPDNEFLEGYTSFK